MSSLILPSRRIVRPSGLVRLDERYDDATTLFVPNVASHNLANNQALTVVGSPSFAVGSDGIEMYSSTYSGASNWLHVRSGNPYVDNLDGVTVIAKGVAAYMSSDGYPAISSLMPYGEYYGGWNLSVEYSSVQGRYIWFRAGDSPLGLSLTGEYETTTGGHYNAGDDFLLIGIFDKKAGKIKFASKVAGVKRYVEHDHAYGWRNAISLENLGGYYRTDARSCVHRQKLTCVIPRPIDSEDALRLLDNPNAIFAKASNRIYFDVGAGGGLGVNATQATADASGNAATVDRQLAITTSQATASASGYGAGVSFGLTISSIQATADASGYLAGIDRHIDVVATTGTASASGYDASVQFGNDLAIAASYGLASADGYQAAINLQAAINATAATASASGYDAAIVSGGLSLTAADLAAIDALIAARISDIAAATLAAATAAGGIDANMTHTNGYKYIGRGIPPTYANQPTPIDPGDPFRVEGT